MTCSQCLRFALVKTRMAMWGRRNYGLMDWSNFISICARASVVKRSVLMRSRASNTSQILLYK